MCKCCQSCLEDLYWMCWEEKYGYDESIANYDPTEDENCRRNGHVTSNGDTLGDNNQPITSQPSRIQRNISINSTKIHEDDIKREIQVANVNLAPEIVQVFANSQIFHDHKPLKIKPTTPQPATFSIGSSNVDKSQLNEQKLLERLEEEDKKALRTKRMPMTPPRIIETPAINEESEDELEVDEVILRPRQLQSATSSEEIRPTTTLVNKNLKNLHLDAPYFTQRPASENDIFTISTPKKSDSKLNVSSTSDVNRFSMTPEVPSISFSHLPKNYAETPTIDKYKKEGPTLLEIQTAELRNSMIDFSMPRYYGKSDLILNRTFDALGSSSGSIASASSSSSSLPRKHHEKSKRLKNFRSNLPPLTIHSKDKHEKDK